MSDAAISAMHKLKYSEAMLLRIVLLSLELVAYAPYGLERPLVGNALELLTKTLDMNVDGTGVTVILKAPDLIKELVSCINSVGVGSEVEQKLKLLGRSVKNRLEKYRSRLKLLSDTGAEKEQLVKICMYECIRESLWFIVLMPLELLICLVIVKKFVNRI